MLKRMAQIGLTNKVTPSVNRQYQQFCPAVHSKGTIITFAFSHFSKFHFITDFLISHCASHYYIFWTQKYLRDPKE